MNLIFNLSYCFTITFIINISVFYIQPTCIAIQTEISMFNIETRIFALFYYFHKLGPPIFTALKECFTGLQS